MIDDGTVAGRLRDRVDAWVLRWAVLSGLLFLAAGVGAHYGAQTAAAVTGVAL